MRKCDVYSCADGITELDRIEMDDAKPKSAVYPRGAWTAGDDAALMVLALRFFFLRIGSDFERCVVVVMMSVAGNESANGSFSSKVRTAEISKEEWNCVCSLILCEYERGFVCGNCLHKLLCTTTSTGANGDSDTVGEPSQGEGK